MNVNEIKDRLPRIAAHLVEQIEATFDLCAEHGEFVIWPSVTVTMRSKTTRQGVAFTLAISNPDENEEAE